MASISDGAANTASGYRTGAHPVHSVEDSSSSPLPIVMLIPKTDSLEESMTVTVNWSCEQLTYAPSMSGHC